jgi:hypothetical protein
MGAGSGRPLGIGQRRALVGPVCVGTIARGGFNDCAADAVHACVGSQGRRLLVLGACDRHVLAVKWFLAEQSDDGEVLVTTPDALEAVLNDDERSNVWTAASA